MNSSNQMCESLMKWFQSIVQNRARNIDELCDGVAMLEALIQIAPEQFNKLEPKIKKDTSSSYIRVSNMKKIVEAVKEYYQDVLSLQLHKVACPDATEIANGDPAHLAKLLRLILGCAIYCDRKQDYILKMTEMEESVQTNIMQAIQELEEVTGRPGFSSLIPDARVSRITTELEAAKEAKMALSQQCQQLEIQVQNLLEEKHMLALENQDIKDKEGRNVDLRKHIEVLKDELVEVVAMRDDFKAKVDDQEKQIVASQKKIAELQLLVNDTSRLKDKVEWLTESAVKVQDLEITVASLRRKLEKYGDMKKTLQMLEEKNIEYLQKNLEYEEELTKTNGWRNQCETYKKQLAEIEQKLDEETQRADKAQFNLEHLQAQFVALRGEKDRIAHERDGLKEEVAELKIVGQPKGKSGAPMSDLLTPTEMKERLRFFEKENKLLKDASQEFEANKALLENALSRISVLEVQKRTANQRVLKLEAQLEEQTGRPQDDKDSAAVAASSESLTKEYKQKVAVLQEAVAAKENELQMMQAKYERCRVKAQAVAEQLDSKSNGDAASLQQAPHMKEREERLLAAAFYKLGMTCHREAIDERLAILGQGQGYSFLARQRQPTPRKQIQRFSKSK